MANSNTAFIPELWAMESLRILEANTVMSNLVHRDFSNEVASFGETVNTRKPAEFKAVPKVDGETVTTQDAVANNIAVVLDQHIHTSFLIYDGEESKSFVQLRDWYLEPAIISLAQKLDEILCGQVYQYLGESVGQLGTAIDKDTLIDAQELMDDNKVPFQNRRIVLPSAMHADLLRDDSFTSAEKVGDDGSALRQGSLGRKFNFDIFMDQNMPSIKDDNLVIVTGAINAGNLGAGTTVFTVDGLSAAITNGSYITIAGDDTPLKVVSTVGGATPTSITVSTGSKRAVLDNAVVSIYTPTLIDFASGYISGWHKDITVDSHISKLGQLLAIGSDVYASGSSIVAPSTTALAPSRNLQSAVVDNDVVGLGPAGNYGLAFTRNALSMVNRPLALPASGTVQSFVANFNGLSIRIVIDYDSNLQGHRVTADMLLGTKVLDGIQGAVILG